MICSWKWGFLAVYNIRTGKLLSYNRDSPVNPALSPLSIIPAPEPESIHSLVGVTSGGCLRPVPFTLSQVVALERDRSP